MKLRCSLDNSIVLPDGRKLAYADIGHQDDFPVIYFHGFPGSRVEAGFSRYLCPEVGVRVMSVERPGYGQSCFYRNRKILDWPQDVCCLADSLGLDRFSVLGVSSGGVYALACAATIPQRLLSVGIAGTPVSEPSARSKMGWATRAGFTMSRQHSVLGELIMGHLFRYLANRQTGLFLHVLAQGAPLADRIAIKDPLFRESVVASLREAYRAGHRGPFYDLHLVSREWGFSLGDIRMPVHLWHGQEDRVIPVAMGRYIADRLTSCMGFFLEGEGHFSVTVNYMEQALRVLKSAAATESDGGAVVDVAGG